MIRAHSMIFFLAVVSGAGCQNVKRLDNSHSDDYSKVTFQVDGMMKAKSGAT
jgi:hypothetical protein